MRRAMNLPSNSSAAGGVAPSASVTPWYCTPTFRRTAVVVLTTFALVQGYWAIGVRENDFVWHLNLGCAFLAGDPYRDIVALYPLGRAMLDAFPAALTYYAARAAVYGLALVALGMIFRIWNQAASPRWPVNKSVSFAAAVGSLALLFPYVLRDLDECGLQILLLFMLSAAMFALSRGRSAMCGLWLGLAATYKVMPLLFLPLLVWKRQWRAAAWMVCFIVVWNLTPALYLGWDTTIRAHTQWLAQVRHSMANVDPAENGIEPPNPRNINLTVAIARFLQTYPKGHPLHLEHPAFVQFGNLDPQTAGRVVKVLLLVFAGVLAWRFRHVWGAGERQADITTEWAAVCVLSALMSPLCWKQHLVVLLPAVFLTWRVVLSNPRESRRQIIGLAVVGLLAIVLKRGLLGRELSIVMMSYKFDTLAALLVMGLVLSLPRSAAPIDSAQKTCDTNHVVPPPAGRSRLLQRPNAT
jgi:hypothetical protein